MKKLILTIAACLLAGTVSASEWAIAHVDKNGVYHLFNTDNFKFDGVDVGFWGVKICARNPCTDIANNEMYSYDAKVGYYRGKCYPSGSIFTIYSSDIKTYYGNNLVRGLSRQKEKDKTWFSGGNDPRGPGFVAICGGHFSRERVSAANIQELKRIFQERDLKAREARGKPF